MLKSFRNAFNFPRIFLMLLFVITIASCSNKGKEPGGNNTDKLLKVATVNYPLYYFARRIGGDEIDVYFPKITGDPAFWHPDMQAIMTFQEADVIFLNGASYAHWLPQVTLPESRTVNTSQDFQDHYIMSKDVITHSHGHEGMHSHRGVVFTTWIDFKQAEAQAEVIKNTLSSKIPAKHALFEENFASLTQDLGKLDSAMMRISGSLKGKTIYVSHPIYDYWARRYGISIVSEHWEPNEEPDERQWAHFEHQLDSVKSDILVWEDTPLRSVQSRLADYGVTCYVFNPCPNMPEQGDFLDQMKKNIVNLRQTAGLK